VGTALDASLSTELLLTIFHPNTPLHDGAVVVNAENRITAAGVLLPLTEDPKLSWQYGTRHRAAIGLTEASDSRCIVVSEESGAISFVQGGVLEKMANAEELRKRLEKVYHVHSHKEGEAKVQAFERFSGFFSSETLSQPLQKIFSRKETEEFPSTETPIQSQRD
jgi:diadenylate cyclase